MASIALGILITAAIAVCVYTYRYELGLVRAPSTPEMPLPESSSPAPETELIAWQTIDRSADGFTVEMPPGAAETRVSAYTAAGSAEPVEMIEASPASGIAFAVSWADNPPVERSQGEDTDRTLLAARDGALARSRASLVDESRASLGVYPAQDFTGRDAKGGLLSARLILVGRRLQTPARHTGSLDLYGLRVLEILFLEVKSKVYQRDHHGYLDQWADHCREGCA